MATKNRAEMIKLALQYINIVPVDGAVSAADSGVVGPILDSLHEQFLHKDPPLVDFATSAFPEGAQMPFVIALSEWIGPIYGKPRPGNFELGADLLAAWIAEKASDRPVEFEDY